MKIIAPRRLTKVWIDIFFSRMQQPGESFDLFLTDLKKLSKQCGFGTLQDSLIKDRILSGLSDCSLKSKLFREEDLDLEKCMRICKASELAQHQLKTLALDAKVHVITKKTSTATTRIANHKPGPANRNKEFDKTQTTGSRRQPQIINQHKQSEHRQGVKKCNRCGTLHERYKCLAYGKACIIQQRHLSLV